MSFVITTKSFQVNYFFFLIPNFLPKKIPPILIQINLFLFFLTSNNYFKFKILPTPSYPLSIIYFIPIPIYSLIKNHISSNLSLFFSIRISLNPINFLIPKYPNYCEILIYHYHKPTLQNSLFIHR